MIDYSMLQEFITEAGEHLDEMETDLLQLEVEPENREILNDIFREIHSIKGAAEYVGLEVTAELSHKLENLLELIRQNKKTVSNEIIDLLIEARDRLVLLNEDLDRFKAEKTEVKDVIQRIEKFSGEENSSEKAESPKSTEASQTSDQTESPPSSETSGPDIEEEEEFYEEEYDEELFDIFLQQLKENLSVIHEQSAKLEKAEKPSGILDEVVKKIEALRSSANYMGYEKLTATYDKWIDRINLAQEKLTNGEQITYGFMTSFLENLLKRFPQVREAFHGEVKEQVSTRRAQPEPPEPAPEPEDKTASAPEREFESEMDFVEAVEKELELLDEEFEEGAVEEDLEEKPEIEKTPEHAPAPARREQKAPPEKTRRAEEKREVIQEAETRDEFEEEVIEPEIEEPVVDTEPEPAASTAPEEKTVPLESVPTDEREVDQVDLSELELLLDDAKLYQKLENAFDSAMGQAHETEDVFDQERMEEELFSPTGQLPKPPEETVYPEEEQEETPLEEVLDDFGQDREPKPWGEQAVTSESEVELEEEEGADLEGEIEEEAEEEAAFVDTEDEIEIPDEVIQRRKKATFGERIVKQTLRVDSRKIDSLMNQVGELVVSRAWFSQLFNEMRDFQQYLKESMALDKKEMKQVRGLTFRLSEATVNLGRVANELQEGIMKIRMLPISQLFNRYPRLVRDLVRDTDKKVRLDVRGEDTELDKMIIEEISDPLVHIIRNAVDHGIEPANERLAKGKPEEGTITLEAYHESNHVIIEVKDDGKGLDPEHIKATALKKEFATREELDQLTPKEITSLIMKPGFSTTDKVTHTSGRGVGMDVVKKNVEKLNGTIEIDSRPGKQTQFRVKIPLTLAIIPALLIRVGKDMFTIPLANVEETIRIYEEETTTIEGVEVIHLRDSTLPLVRLSEVFGIPSLAKNSEKAFVVVVSTGMRKVGLVVDSLIGQEEVVIKPLVDYLQESSGFSGATILGDGSISLILDVYELVNLTIDRRIRRIASYSQTGINAMDADYHFAETRRKSEITES